MLNVMVIGSGSREHAIVWKLLLSSNVKDIFVAPGNGGTALIARNLDIMAKDIKGLADAAVSHGVSLVIVGPEDPLALGIVDAFESLGIPTFGPSKEAAMIEASKSFAKSLMERHGIPCARGRSFTSYDEARDFVAKSSLPVVVKADGLATGKGVTVAGSYEEAFAALEQVMLSKAFGSAGDTVVVEECLTGREVSLLCFTDGKTVVPMVPACDYKRVFDDDQGPNTGGMGCYSPPAFFGPDLVEKVKTTVLEPVVRALASEGRPYKGVLYAGLMITADGLRVLEFNCRFGDPEAQAILPRLKTDLVDIVEACLSGTLDQLKIEWSDEPTVGVVMASGGYPGKYATGQIISGLDSIDGDIRVFHGGTRLVERSAINTGPIAFLSDRQSSKQNVELLTDGGRVLTVVGSGRTMAEARRKVYANVGKITFSGRYFRTDIALREIPALETQTTSPSPETPKQTTDDPGIRAVISQAEAAQASGRDQEAIELIERALLERPDSLALKAALGTAYASTGQIDLAVEQWREVVRLSPEDAEARHNLGSLYLRQRQLELAIAEMREAIRLDADYMSAYLALGAMLAKADKYDEATGCYEKAIALNPKSPEAHLDFAMVLSQAGKRGQAVKELQACLDNSPNPETRREAEEMQKKLSKRGWF